MNIDQINRHTAQGKALWAALIILTTENFRTKTPGEVIDYLLEKERHLPGSEQQSGFEGKVVKNNNQDNSSCVITETPFRHAVGKAIDEKRNSYSLKVKSIEEAADVIIEQAREALSPAEQAGLAGALVKIYLHHADIK